MRSKSGKKGAKSPRKKVEEIGNSWGSNLDIMGSKMRRNLGKFEAILSPFSVANEKSWQILAYFERVKERKNPLFAGFKRFLRVFLDCQGFRAKNFSYRTNLIYIYVRA